MSGNIVPRTEKFQKMEGLLSNPATLARIKRALPRTVGITEEQMARVFLTALTITPKLLDCDPMSLLKAVMEAAQLGLLTDGVLGHGYILPYGNTAKFIPGYRGLIDLARRSGHVNSIQARAVFEDDEFDYGYGLEPYLVHKPAPRNEGLTDEELRDKVIAFYATATLATGEVVFEVMYRDDIEAIRRRSPAGKSGPWVTDWVEMGKKTVIRRLMKSLPLSAEAQRAVVSDEYAEAGVLDRLIGHDEGVVDAEGVETLDSLVRDGEPEAPATEDPEFAGKGKISSEEDEKFEAAIQALLVRARAASTEELTNDMFNKFLGTHGVTKTTEIRSRADRESFYHTVREEVEAWERLA